MFDFVWIITAYERRCADSMTQTLPVSQGTSLARPNLSALTSQLVKWDVLAMPGNKFFPWINRNKNWIV